MEIALVVYDGVLHDECEAFRSVLGLVERATVVTVGARPGWVAGPGGRQQVDRTFGATAVAEVVIVPGGLGCERAAEDPELRDFLHRMDGVARLVAASSTGTVVLAAAGLLHGEPAATHWLAADLLRRYGSELTDRRLLVTGNVVTCEGRVSAVEAAFTLAERLEGHGAVERIRSILLERGQPLLHHPVRRRWLGPVGDHHRDRPADPPPPATASTAATRAGAPPVTPVSVMLELVPNDELRRRLRSSQRRRR